MNRVAITVAILGMSAGVALAQAPTPANQLPTAQPNTPAVGSETTTNPAPTPGPGAVTPHPAMPGAPATTLGSGAVRGSPGQDNSSTYGTGNMKTSSASTGAPAAGANSFTQSQARARIESRGVKNVTGLAKDKNGVWRGTATRGADQVKVAVDYKGNVVIQ